MTASLHEICVEELAEARLYFENSPQSQLILTATKFNEEQPYFSAVGEAFRRMNIAQYSIQELLQSVFEVYYVVTVLHHQKIKPIDISDIKKGVDLLGELTKFDYRNISTKSINGSLTTLYFKNPAVFEHSIDAMNRAFGDLEAIVDHRESLAVYNALLRAMEIAE